MTKTLILTETDLIWKTKKVFDGKGGFFNKNRTGNIGQA